MPRPLHNQPGLATLGCVHQLCVMRTLLSSIFALGALETPNVHVRAMAATALNGWTEGDSASRVARHLDDVWEVAVPAARSLRSMGESGMIALQASAGRTDLAGVLARQMLWERQPQC